MKKFFKTTFAALMAALAFSACAPEKEAQMAALDVKINMPEGFTTVFAGDVVITSNELGKTYTAKAENGTVTFESIYPGIYELQISSSMTKADAQAAAPEVENINGDILLNGTKKGIAVDIAAENAAEVSLSWSLESKLLISRVYCNGTKTDADIDYNFPKYYEIFNNSSEVQYLDGLCMAEAHGMTTTNKGTCELYVKYQKEATYASRIAKLPGTHGTDKNIALEPGKSFVIAWNAQNFIVEEDVEGGADKCTKNVDLTGADYELLAPKNPHLKHVNNANVPDMEQPYECNPGLGFGDLNQAIFIFFATTEEIDTWETATDQTSYDGVWQKKWKAKRVDNKIIIDAVETFKTGTNKNKRIADIHDASGVESNNNEAVIFDRKIQRFVDGRIVLQDTNNSKNDFVAVTSENASHLVIRDYNNPAIQPGN